MKRLLTTLLLAAAAWTAPAQGRIETFTLRSDILGCEKSCSVYLPEGYDDTTDDYPVLYLLPADTMATGPKRETWPASPMRRSPRAWPCRWSS